MADRMLEGRRIIVTGGASCMGTVLVRAPPAIGGGPAAIPRVIHQFWDDAPPPEDIAALMASWDGYGDYAHQVLSRRDAVQFLRAEYGEEWVMAFRLASNPAESADFLRLCLLARQGGVWIDADDEAVGDLEGVFHTVDGGAGGALDAEAFEEGVELLAVLGLVALLIFISYGRAETYLPMPSTPDISITGTATTEYIFDRTLGPADWVGIKNDCKYPIWFTLTPGKYSDDRQFNIRLDGTLSGRSVRSTVEVRTGGSRLEEVIFYEL